jgi:hypothetical protein
MGWVMADNPRPKQAIRRFDVFAEYSKLRALSEGRPLDEAKGYGLWLAKLVAARRFGKSRSDRGSADPPTEREPFRSLGGEAQTDKLFDREIVARMGERFYRDVFAPEIARRFDQGDRYEAIRDSVRKAWRPAP